MIAAAYSRALNCVLTADPGLLRLRNALRSTLACSLTATVSVSWALQHHQQLALAALGTLFAMIAPLFLRDARLSGWLLSLSCLYVCTCACFTVSVAVALHPLLRNASLLLIVFAGMLCQPLGPRAVGCALLALVASYLGLYLHPSRQDLLQILVLSTVAPAIVVLVGRFFIPTDSGPTQRLAAGTVLQHALRAFAVVKAEVCRTTRSVKHVQQREPGVIASIFGLGSKLAWMPAAPATVAACLAMLIGNWLSNERWMWAVISVFVVFLGTTSRNDTVYRVMQRAAGTLSGAFVSALLVQVFRYEPWLLVAAMTLSVFGWAYYILHAYARGVFFITVLVGLVYAQLGFAIVPLVELRVEEVIAGCLISVVVAMLMMPAARRVGAHSAQGAG
jgi:hypothetical protein